MNKKPIELLFDAMYHTKYDFADFARGDVSKNYAQTLIQVKGRMKGTVILRPNKKLKAYHKFLSLFLLDYLKVNERVVFSYRKGVSAVDAVSVHAKSRCFFQTDISDFFPSIDAGLIRATITGSQDRSPIADMENYIDRVLELVTVNGSLPIGFSTSPAISNACLFDFDNALEAYCLTKSLTYSRYSDDMIISSESKSALGEIFSTVDSMLQGCFDGKLRLNPHKSRFSHAGSKIKILGMVILPNGKVTVDMKFKSNIEVLLHFFVTDKGKFLDKVKCEMDEGMERIGGYLNYVNTVDKSYLDKLRKKFGATVVDTFLHRPPT